MLRDVCFIIREYKRKMIRYQISKTPNKSTRLKQINERTNAGSTILSDPNSKFLWIQTANLEK